MPAAMAAAGDCYSNTAIQRYSDIRDGAAPFVFPASHHHALSTPSPPSAGDRPKATGAGHVPFRRRTGPAAERQHPHALHHRGFIQRLEDMLVPSFDLLPATPSIG
ncbi:hypothetical protein VDGD_21442 [Verticillium dahliae]|nr:hypothetical protein VDGD_21442 [Verticillium dahliae]